MTYDFDEFQLNDELFELRRDGQLLSVQRMVLATLVYLIEHRDRVVTKDELIAGPWQGVSVSDASISQAVMLVRKVLDDDGAHQRFIKTVRGVGYRFVAELRTRGSEAGAPDRPASTGEPLGRESPLIPTHEVAGAAGTRSLFGRQLELAEAERALDAARGGEGSVLLLAGPPGIGKTYLCEHIAARAASVGIPALWGRSWEQGGAPAFWPWIQVFRRLLSDPELDAASEVSPREVEHLIWLLPEIADCFPETRRRGTASPSPQRLELFESVASVLRRIAKRHGALLLVLEDLHACDLSSVSLLDYLAKGLHQSHLLIAGTYRDVELRSAEAIATLVTGLHGVRSSHSLLGLEESAVAEMLDTQLKPGVQDELVRRIHRVTAGNPLFLREVRRLLDADRLAGLDLHRVQFRIPGRIVEAIRGHLRRLPEATRRLCELGAVIGPDFELPLMQVIVQRPLQELLETLTPALEAGLLQDSYEALARYRFAHDLIRTTAIADIAPAQRMGLHRQVADAIESHYGPWNAPYSRLAHHFLAAAPSGVASKAVHYSVKAGDQAMRSTAYAEGIEHYRLALEALEWMPDAVSERGDVLMRLGQAQRFAGYTDQAMQTFAGVVALARKTNLPVLLAKAALGHGFTWRAWASDDTLIALLQEALDGLDGRDSRLRVVVMARLAASLWFSGPAQATRRARLSAEAIAIARRLGNPVTLSVALICAHTANWGVMSPEAQLELATEIVTSAQASPTPDGQASLQEGRLWRIADLSELGRFTEADREIARYAKDAEQVKHPLELSWVARWRSVRRAMAGRIDEALALASEARDLGRRAGDRNASPFYWEQRNVLSAATGVKDDVVERSERVVEHNPDLVLARLRLARAYCAVGSEARARDIIAELDRDGFSRMPDNHTRFAAIVAGAVACSHLGAASAANKLHAILLPDAERILTFGTAAVCYGPAHHFLGLLSTAAGSPERAIAHFERAALQANSMDAPLWLIQAQLGEASARLRHEGQSPAARDLIEAALTTSRELELPGLVQRARALLATVA
jgi:DNA-binding winged helix-turn-helix (wHTH) protein/tetratricopeptide (TPR) repeat protein